VNQRGDNKDGKMSVPSGPGVGIKDVAGLLKRAKEVFRLTEVYYRIAFPIPEEDLEETAPQA
jgi:hypothetical protein